MKNNLVTLFKSYSEVLSVHQRAYLQHVHEYPCVKCLIEKRTNYGVHAHHELLSAQFAYSKRFTDFTVLPLCQKHHEKRHAIGFDSFWSPYPPIPFEAAQKMLIEFLSITDKEKFCNDFFINRKKFDNLLYKIINKLVSKGVENGQE